MRNRRGVTLTELLIAMVIVGIIGAAFTRLMVTQGRFFDGQNALRSARTVSRGALNIMTGDIRMIEPDGGVKAASRDSILAWVPFSFGFLCGTAGGQTTVSVQPTDSLVWANNGFSGYAWRDASGGFSYIPQASMNVLPGATNNTPGANSCSNAGI